MSEKTNFKAFNEGGMDEFFRKTVEGHRVEPKPGLWKGLSRTLLWREIAHFNFTNLSVKFRVMGVAGILILAVTLYNIFPSATPPVVPPAMSTSAGSTGTNFQTGESKPISSTPMPKSNQTATGSAKVYNASQLVTASVKPSGTTVSKSPKPVEYANNLRNSMARRQTRDNSIAQKYSSPAQEYPSTVATENTGLSTYVEQGSISQLVPFETALLLINPYPDTVITLTTSAGISRFLITKPSSPQFFSANLGVVPEMSFYSEPETYSKMNVWINAGLTWHFSRFSLATTPGLGYVFDKSRYRVELKSNDSIGYFTSVISYTVGTNNEIIYNTVTTNIYDSLLHQNDYRTMNRYAYLQVPLLLGYRLVETGRVSLTFQAGPAVSFLLGTRKSSPVIEYDHARIVRVDDNTPTRVHTNWQVWGNLLLELRMNRKISIYFEPSCKYFLKSMVEQENVSFKAPWSVGLGFGIQFNFAPKKNNP